MKKNYQNCKISIGDTDMYYVSFGSGDKKLIVLPGLSDGLATVRGKARLLYFPYRKHLKKYTVYMFSRKNKMPAGYTIREMAEELNIDKASILGVSQGGMIAQYIAIDHPELVEKLILAVTAPYANNVVKNAVENWIRLAKKGDHKALMTDTAKKTYTQPFFKRYRFFIPLSAILTKPAGYERFLRNACAILGFDARDELSKISCRTLILSGDDDHIVGNKAARQLNQKIPGSVLHICKGFGHGLFEECKDFYDMVFDYLQSGKR